MKHLISLTLASTLLALLILLAGERGSAQTTGSTQKAQVQQPTATQMNSAKGGARGAFDDDGDGILNCNDPDYVRPRDGTGKQFGKMNGGKGMHGRGAVAPGSMGTGGGMGVCDGTGPKGKGRGK